MNVTLMFTSSEAPAESCRVNPRQPSGQSPPPERMNAIACPESLQTFAGADEPSLQSASVSQREPAQFVPSQLARQRLMGPMQVPSGEPAPQSASTWHGLPMQSAPPFSVQPGKQCWLS